MAKRIPKCLPTLKVWDVGASKKPLRVFASHANVIEMYGFEPNKIEARITQADWSKLPWSRLEILTLALGNEEGLKKLYIAEDPGWSSVYKPNFDLLSQYKFSAKASIVREELVEFATGGRLINDGIVPEPDFIKLDTQGSELTVLEGMSRQSLKNLLGVQVETEFVPMYKNQPLFDDVMSFLRKWNLFPVALRTASFEKNNSEFRQSRYRTLYSHTLFMKDPFDQDLSETELVKLALLYAIHGFFDDALNLLSRQRLLIEKELEEALSWLKREPFSASLSKNWTRRKFDRIVYALRSDPWEENFKGWRRGDSSLPQWPY